MMIPQAWRLIIYSCALAVFLASQAFPHGGDHGGASASHGANHGKATAPHGGVSLVSVQGYQVELLTEPSPVRVGTEARIVTKVQKEGSRLPGRDGKVFMKMEATKSAGALTASQHDSSGYHLASEETWAGNYTAKLTPDKEGLHRVTVVMAELAGEKLEPPVVVDFSLRVAPSAGMNGTFIALTLMAMAMAGVGIWTFVAKARYGGKESRFNLLDIPWLKKLLLSRALQPSLQIPLLVLLIVLVVLGFKDIQDGGKNLTTKLVWTLWWPGIIFTFIIVGRLWCFVCPFGALNEWAARLVKPSRMWPRAFRSLWPASVTFVLLTLADEQLGVVRSPQITAWILILFAIVSLGIGFLFQRRSFCRYLCPLGGLIGVYAMHAPLELRTKSKAICQADASKACYRGSHTACGCPMFEFPLGMDRNTYCNLCFKCVQACPNGNLALRLRAFGQDLWATSKRTLDESYFAIALVGITSIVTAQMLAAWQPFISWLATHLGPLRAWMKPMTYLTLTEAAVFLVGSLALFPLLLWLAALLASPGDRKQGGAKRAFIIFGYMFAPIGLAMHLAHNLAHLLMEGPGIVPVFQRFVNIFTPFSLGEPAWETAPLFDMVVVHWLQIALPLLLFAFSIKVGQQLIRKFYGDDAAAWRTLAPMVALALVFTVLNVYLLSLPMAMRHGM